MCYEIVYVNTLSKGLRKTCAQFFSVLFKFFLVLHQCALMAPKEVSSCGVLADFASL